MSLPFRRGSRPRGTARLALAGDFPDDGQDITDTLGQPDEWDGTTITFTGASIVGLPDDVTAIGIQTGPHPLNGYRPAPPSFPALPPPPPAPVIAEVEITEPAVIGDDLRLPVIWCDMPRCINWHLDRDSLGERDARNRAAAAGWRDDALGRFACPECQQTRPDYWTPQPVAWHHPSIARGWHERGTLPTDTGAFRLSIEAEYGKRISRENPVLARAIAGATSRHDSHPAVTS